MITDSSRYLSDVDQACAYIKSRLEGREIPTVCIVAGSGLAPLAGMCEDVLKIPYQDIPRFPRSTAPGHEGTLVAGYLGKRPVFVMNGRFHYYEGYDTEVVTFYVRVMGRIGVKVLFLTNAAGGMDETINPPELVAITDHLSFHVESPLRGQNINDWGPRFPDQSYVYDKELVSLLLKCAKEKNINLRTGIYAYSKGPQYETPAEIRALKLLGADCVGMSTVPESIAASHMGIRVCAMSCITNMAAGISTGPLSEQEVLDRAAEASEMSCTLVRDFINSLPDGT